jgi:hypothetical protein
VVSFVPMLTPFCRSFPRHWFLLELENDDVSGTARDTDGCYCRFVLCRFSSPPSTQVRQNAAISLRAWYVKYEGKWKRRPQNFACGEIKKKLWNVTMCLCM